MSGKQVKHHFVDLIIADLPEGLPVPGVSDPPTSIPAWNEDSTDFWQNTFDFAENHLHDDGAMILFHPYHAATKSNILGYCNAFNFRVRKEWWAMNRLHLTSPFDPSVTVSFNAMYNPPHFPGLSSGPLTDCHDSPL